MRRILSYMNIFIPKKLLDHIDLNRGSMSRALYVINCIDHVVINQVILNTNNTDFKTECDDVYKNRDDGKG